MDLMPGSAKLLSTGRYQAFPYAASRPSDDTVVGAWRAAAAHQSTPSGGVVTMAAISSDGGDTWSAPFTAYDDHEALADHAPAGLVWDERSQRWMMLLLRVTYKTAQDTKPYGYGARLLTSTDGRTWKPLGVSVPTTGTSWLFVTDLAIGDNGEWIVAGYGRLSGASQDQPIVTTSADRGATWSSPIAPSGLPAGVSFAETQIVRHPSGWLMLVRGDDDCLHQVRPDGAGGWAYDRSVIGGVSGQPEVAVTTAGVLVTVLRQVTSTAADKWHGSFAWAYSEDVGATWVLRTDFPDETRPAMYAGLAPLRDGGLACVYAAEDDPKKTWGSASVWTTRFVSSALYCQQSFDENGAPLVTIAAGMGQPIMRHTIDPVTGDEVVDEVRIKTSLLGGGAYDYELQQGQVAYYTAGARRTRDVIGDVLPGNMLIHPTRPELSMRLDVVKDDDAREYAMDVNVQPVPAAPGLAGLQYPIVTSIGSLGAPSGTTLVRTYTLSEKSRLELLLADLCPLFWSTHPGEDLPDWIRITKLTAVRFIDQCTSSYASWDDHADITQWRHWSMSWVAQPRPTTAGMPLKHRIRDVRRPIKSIDEKYEVF